ncbi:hypothetical protein KEM48_005296 [Puccinia striiformis f. sp. tritici PST-130]|nr:hypothetical protein KEM48_005296 [Puccinia striiformis f. sp. tritici PST-130]
MDTQHDPLSSWKTSSWPNPSSIQPPPSRRFSTRSDRERDAPDYARALSSDVNPYASSIISSSDSNSHCRSSRGSRGSIASSLLCPLLEFHDSSRRQSDAGLIMPMRPLPAIDSASDPSTLYNTSHLDSAYRAQPLIKQSSGTSTGMLSSTAMSNSNSTSGGNLFIPLRQTQLFGELLLALEEYVAAFGRQVKVSPSHQFSLGGGSAAAAVVAAASGPSTQTGLPSSDFTAISRDEETPSTDQDPTLINLDSPETDEWGPDTQDSTTEEFDEKVKAVHLTSQTERKVDRALLAELCEELEYVTSEVIDVVPAFGEKMVQGHYGPLAGKQAKTLSALERFSDYEPGGSQDTSDGGSAWWAERLLRDLLEGIVAETVVKSGSTITLLSAKSNVSSTFDQNQYHSEIGHLSNQNYNHHKINDRKGTAHTTNFIGGKPKTWLRIPQSSSLSRSSSITNNHHRHTGKSSHTGNHHHNINHQHQRDIIGFSLIDEREESTTIPEYSKRKHDRLEPKNLNLQTMTKPTSSNGDLIVVPDDQQYHSNLTRELLAEASQDSIFEYRHSNLISTDKDSADHHHPQSKDEFSSNRRSTTQEPVDFLGESDSEETGGRDRRRSDSRHGNVGMEGEEEDEDKQHQQKLLDEGRKRWLAFKATQTDHTTSLDRSTTSHPPPHPYSGPNLTTAIMSRSSTATSGPDPLAVDSFLSTRRGRSSTGLHHSSSISKSILPLNSHSHSQPRQLYNYLASHRS